MIVLHFVVCLLRGSMVGVNGDLLQEGLCHKLGDQGSCTQSPCPCGGPLLTPSPSTGDTQTQFWLSLCGVSEPSEHLWQVWGLILNVISPLLPSCWGFSFALGCRVSFLGGSFFGETDNILSMTVQL